MSPDAVSGISIGRIIIRPHITGCHNGNGTNQQYGQNMYGNGANQQYGQNPYGTAQGGDAQNSYGTSQQQSWNDEYNNKDYE